MSTTTPPNLGIAIPSPLARRIIYATYVIALVAVGAASAWFRDPDPTWIAQAGDVLTYVGIPVGTLALVNAPTTSTPST